MDYSIITAVIISWQRLAVSSSWRVLYWIIGEQNREAKRELRLIRVQGIGACENSPESRGVGRGNMKSR
jgi:hypothetical protein